MQINDAEIVLTPKEDFLLAHSSMSLTVKVKVGERTVSLDIDGSTSTPTV